LIYEFPSLNAAQCASLIAPYKEQTVTRRRSTRVVTLIDIHRLHRLTQIKRINALDATPNHLWPSVKSVDNVMIEAAVAG
jgi:hypothetical protein